MILPAGPARPRLVQMLEDDEAIITIVALALKKAGVELRSARSLLELESQAALGAPDLFLLDVNLPDGSGFEACRRLRDLPPTAKTPIIFLTRRDEIENRLRAFRLGAQDYIIKPFSVEELVARVQAHLRLKIQLDAQESQLAELALHLRVQTDLMDMVIHDIRTPISTVELTLSMLAQSGMIDAAQNEKLLTMGRQATDAAILMLNDLLDLRAGRVAAELAAFPLDRPLRRAAEILAPKAAERGIAVALKVSPEEGRAVSDEKMLLRVILNLLGNAIKFTGNAAPVEMSLSHAEGMLQLEVADRGRGVPDADSERIFEKFQRSGEGEEAVPGTGIGLAFCRLAAQTLGGRVWVSPRPGGGSVFSFEVPAQAAVSGGEAAELLGPAVMKEYRDDCAVQLAAVESALARESPISPEFLESVRLAAHRLSGSAGTYGYAEASRVAARLERRVLEARKAGPQLAPQPEEIRLSLREIRRGLDL